MFADGGLERSKKSDVGVSGATVIIVLVFMICFMAFLDVITWISFRGGLLSVIAAASEVKERPRSVEVDSAGLRLAIIIPIDIICIAVCVRLKHFKMTSRVAGLVFGAIVIGGGFLIDAGIDRPIIDNFMFDHGYIRCSTRDLHVGTGKGSVWFDDYVATKQACVARRATISDSSPGWAERSK